MFSFEFNGAMKSFPFTFTIPQGTYQGCEAYVWPEPRGTAWHVEVNGRSESTGEMAAWDIFADNDEDLVAVLTEMGFDPASTPHVVESSRTAKVNSWAKFRDFADGLNREMQWHEPDSGIRLQVTARHRLERGRVYRGLDVRVMPRSGFDTYFLPWRRLGIGGWHEEAPTSALEQRVRMMHAAYVAGEEPPGPPFGS